MIGIYVIVGTFVQLQPVAEDGSKELPKKMSYRERKRPTVIIPTAIFGLITGIRWSTQTQGSIQIMLLIWTGPNSQLCMTTVCVLHAFFKSVFLKTERKPFNSENAATLFPCPICPLFL